MARGQAEHEPTARDDGNTQVRGPASGRRHGAHDLGSPPPTLPLDERVWRAGPGEVGPRSAGLRAAAQTRDPLLRHRVVEAHLVIRRPCVTAALGDAHLRREAHLHDPIDRDELPVRSAGHPHPDPERRQGEHADAPELRMIDHRAIEQARHRHAQPLIDGPALLRHEHRVALGLLRPGHPRPDGRVDLGEPGELLPRDREVLGGERRVGLGAGPLKAVGDGAQRARRGGGGLLPALLVALGLGRFEPRPGLLRVTADEHQELLARQRGLRRGVIDLLALAFEQAADPVLLAAHHVEAAAVLGAVGDVVEDLDVRERVALSVTAAVALIELLRRPADIHVVNRAGAALEIDALLADGVGDEHVVLGGDGVAAVELARGSLPIGRGGRDDGVEDADPLGGDTGLDEHVANPHVRRDVVGEDDVTAAAQREHALGQGVELRRVRRRDQVRVAPLELLIELGVLGDARHPLQEAEDLVRALLGIGERALDLLDVPLVLLLLGGIHVDEDAIDPRRGQPEGCLFGRLELPELHDDAPELVEVLEADARHARLGLHLDVHHLLGFEQAEAVDERLRIVNANPAPRLVVHQLDEVVELQR